MNSFRKLDPVHLGHDEINQRKIDFSIGPKLKETQCRFTAVGSDNIVSRASETS